MVSVVVILGIIYWILLSYNFALWFDLMAYDMPLEGYIIKKFGLDCATAGWWWLAFYVFALLVQ